ncbi:MAG: excinuclease ABC subunit UvrA [bacterium]|nr:excinuclease ABC subunit UvrA [bacterium]
MNNEKIIIKGAKEHNLKNIDLEIPRNKFTVFTGLSGSGKSSLAFDTIYAEGRRRYIESLSAYARQFLGQIEKPDVEYIEGLSPAIAIEQKTISKNPRSTVGTITEIYDYFRLLYSRIGVPYCYKCGKKIERQTAQEIVDQILLLKEKTKVEIMAPLIRGQKGEYQKLFKQLEKDGFIRVRVDGNVFEVNEEIKMDKNKKHHIEAVVDRLVISSGIQKRLTDSVETALKMGQGLVLVSYNGKNEIFSETYSCSKCGINLVEMSPRMFSFNSPFGACPECSGLGTKMELDPDLVVPDKSKSIFAGCIEPWSSESSYYYSQIMENLSRHFNFKLNTPWKDLDPKIRHMILYGSGDEIISFEYHGSSGSRNYKSSFEGVIKNLERRFKETKSDYIRDWIGEYMASRNCPACKGNRLKPEVLAIKIEDRNIIELCSYSIKELIKFFNGLSLSEKDRFIGQRILKEIKARLAFLSNVGLDYLTLNRNAGTLSGGEAQRIRLATQIGSGLVGVLYVLDEPSIGLHARDNDRLIESLIKLRDMGNTLIVVEHDEKTIRTADFIVDLGPGAGVNGGEVIVAGTIKDIIACGKSLTGQYLRKEKEIEIPSMRRKAKGKFLKFHDVRHNNLKNIDVEIPLGLFVCVTGVSGSGKSSLVEETIYPALTSHFFHSGKFSGVKSIHGLENIDKVIDIDQSPIGRTPRSNPATYTGLFAPVREIFALLPDSKVRGYKAGRFSFNVKGGRCEACEGDGIIRIGMYFLPDVYVPCEVCQGKRYNRETLEIRYKGKNIYEILEMSVDEALPFFKNIPAVNRILQTIYDVGLGYIKLGQPATTLSGGEAQRIKLSSELSKRATGKTLYLLDEPTTGLHFDDVKKLLEVLNRLVDSGNTVLLIEHNLDVIKTADHIIDLGPEGGDEGGYIVAEGTPEEIIKIRNSYTGRSLKEIL